MDGFVSLIDGEVRCLFFAFSKMKWEWQAQRIFRKLQARNRISRQIGIIYLPTGMAIPVRGLAFYCFILELPPDDNTKATIATLAGEIKKKLGIDLHETENPQLASTLTTVVMEVRRRS